MLLGHASLFASIILRVELCLFGLGKIGVPGRYDRQIEEVAYWNTGKNN